MSSPSLAYSPDLVEQTEPLRGSRRSRRLEGRNSGYNQSGDGIWADWPDWVGHLFPVCGWFPPGCGLYRRGVHTIGSIISVSALLFFFVPDLSARGRQLSPLTRPAIGGPRGCQPDVVESPGTVLKFAVNRLRPVLSQPALPRVFAHGSQLV